MRSQGGMLLEDLMKI